MKLSMTQKQTHREQTCGCQEGEWGRDPVGVWLADANYRIQNG